MSTNEKLRLLFLITSPKMAKKAEEMLSTENLPFSYRLNAKGTATSEVMDILGLGSAEKGMLVCLAGKAVADAMLLKLHKALKIGTVNSGIAYTIPLDAASKIIFRSLGGTTAEENRKEQKNVSDKQRAMIVAVVNLGYSEDVMDAARAAGAGGGTVVHSRSLNTEDANLLGGGWTEEKDIVMIAASADNKLAIMQAIGEKCGVNSEAKGIVFSLPIENVIGLSED